MKIISKQAIAYTAVVFIITGPFFIKPGYLFFTDFAFGPHVALNFFSTSFFVNFVIKALSLFLFYDLGQKLFIALTIGLLFWGGEKICEHFTDKPLVSFVAGLFFVFNPFVYDRLMYGQIGIVAGLACLCMSFGYLLQYLKRPSKPALYFSGVWIGLAFQCSLHFIFLFIVLYAAFIALLAATSRLGEIVNATLVIVTIVLVLNANWLLAVATGHPLISGFLAEGITRQDLALFKVTGENSLQAATHVLTLSGFWAKDQLRYVDVTRSLAWQKSIWLLLPIIIGGLWLGLTKKEHQKTIVCMLAVFISAFILAVGIQLPVARTITYWLFDHMPFYKGIRETQKWVALLVIVYGILLTIGINAMMSAKRLLNNQYLVATIVCIIIVLQAPFLLVGFGGQMQATQYPQSWAHIDQRILSDQHNPRKCNATTLFLPWHLYMSFRWIGHIVANPAALYFSCPTIIGTNMELGGIYDNSQDPAGIKVEQWIQNKGRNNTLAALGVQYVIVNKELDWQTYQWLDSVPSLKLIEENQEFKLYKNDPI